MALCVAVTSVCVVRQQLGKSMVSLDIFEFGFGKIEYTVL